MWRQDWRSFLKNLKWRYGEHIAIIGSTGGGKTTLALELAKQREDVILFATKGRDSTLSRYIEENDYEQITRWPPSRFREKVALWPHFDSVEDFDRQAMVFREAINGTGKDKGIYKQGGWTVIIDEVMYFVKNLGIQKELEMLWTQGRSSDISVVASSQRPRVIPQEMLDQSTHFFYFQTDDEYEIKRMSEVVSSIRQEVRLELVRLGPHEFLYFNRKTKQLVKSQVRR